MKTPHIILTTLTALALTSCQNKKDDTNTSDKGPSPELKAVIEAPVEAKAQDIHVIRESAKPGDTITITGKIMGRESPFVEGRAAFTLGDPKVITACNERPDDHCKTPWDNCCDTPEDKQRATATIQVVDESGRVLKEGIEGVGGIEKLSKLLVTGTVAEGSSSENLVINAIAIEVE